MANYTKRAGFYLNVEEKAVLDLRAAGKYCMLPP